MPACWAMVCMERRTMLFSSSAMRSRSVVMASSARREWDVGRLFSFDQRGRSMVTVPAGDVPGHGRRSEEHRQPGHAGGAEVRWFRPGDQPGADRGSRQRRDQSSA